MAREFGRTYLPTSTQKSPRMVPGMASPGSVAPMRAREARTTSNPCHTCRGYCQCDKRSQTLALPLQVIGNSPWLPWDQSSCI